MRMEKNSPEFEYFPHDREQLLTTIARFDDGLRVEDVVCPENESDNLKQYSNTVLVQVLLEFICHAFVKEENYREKLLMEVCKRLSKFKILNDLLIMDKNNELRKTVKHKVINFLKQVSKEVIPTSELNTSAVHLFQKESLSTELKLHYCKNYIELGKIAEGGFGSVYKVQYKLNKLIYAVKKIPFSYKTDTNFLMVMREANNFATLDHINIVRYYSAWIEMADSDVMSKPPSENVSFASNINEDKKTVEHCGLTIKEELLHESSDCLSIKNKENRYYISSNSAESDSVLFSSSAKASNDINWIVENYSKSPDHSDEDARNALENCNDTEDFSHSNLKIQGLLYIQMEFCDCDLQFWLDKRAETKGKELPFEMDVYEIFTNIVKGVAHIHSKGIIHRDLKPHNIFYSQSCNTVKIGDFGLATLSGFSDSFYDVSYDHSSSVGTIPYAAPEQIKSKKYDMKVDIYSLGVILIELINICSTRAELIYIIKGIRDGKIRESEKFPILGNLANVLLSDNPNQRWSAKEILDFIDKDSKVILKEVVRNEIMMEIKERDETIQNLKETVKELIDRIRDLDNRYKKLEGTPKSETK